jgi:hypothetical protein
VESVSSEDDSLSYSGGSSPLPPPRDDRPPKRQSTDGLSFVGLSRSFTALSDDPDAIDEDEILPAPPVSKDKASAKPVHTKTQDVPKSQGGARPKKDTPGGGSSRPSSSATSKTLHGTGTGSRALKKRKREDEDEDEDEAGQSRKKKLLKGDKEEKRKDEHGMAQAPETKKVLKGNKEEKETRYAALRPILEEGSAAAFFDWLHKDMGGLKTIDHMEWEHYIMVFLNGAAPVRDIQDMDHSDRPSKRLYSNGLTQDFLGWLNSVVHLPYPTDTEEMHQLIDAYLLTTNRL